MNSFLILVSIEKNNFFFRTARWNFANITQDMGNYIFHFENWLGISSSSTYAGQKKLSHEFPWFHRDFSYLLSYFYICKWKDLSTFSMPFIRMIIINKKTNNAAPLKLMTCLYAVYLNKNSHRKSSQSNNKL